MISSYTSWTMFVTGVHSPATRLRKEGRKADPRRPWLSLEKVITREEDKQGK